MTRHVQPPPFTQGQVLDARVADLLEAKVVDEPVDLEGEVGGELRGLETGKLEGELGV